MNELTTLTTLGLSTYEADAYLALIERGVSNADEISKKANIPYGRIYSVLSSLAGKGLVNIQNSRPKLFSPVDPRLTLKRLLEAQKTSFDNEYEQLVQLAKDVEGPLTARVVETKVDSPFWTVSVGKDDVNKLNNQHFDEAKKEIVIFVGDAEMFYEEFKTTFPELYESLDRAAERGVKVRILFGFRNLKSLPLLLKDAIHQGMDILPSDIHRFRFVESTSSAFEVFDNERVFVKVNNPIDQSKHLAAISVLDIDLAKELLKNFNQLWKQGVKLTEDQLTN